MMSKSKSDSSSRTWGGISFDFYRPGFNVDFSWLSSGLKNIIGRPGRIYAAGFSLKVSYKIKSHD